MVAVHSQVIHGRKYIDVVDLELFLRRVQERNPHLTVDGYVKHVIREVCERG